MLLNDINARIGELDAELEGIAALTDPTDDDVARTRQILDEKDELRKQGVAAQERQQLIAQAHAKAQAEGRSIHGGSFEVTRKIDPFEVDLRILDDQELRSAAYTILDRPEAKHLTADAKAKVESIVGRMSPHVARHVVATSTPAYRSAFAKYCAGNSDLLTNDERRAVQEVRALVLADASGGYAVPALLDPTIILTSDGSANPMRQISRIVTGIDDTWRGVSSAGITASWDSEAVQVSDDAPTLAQPTVVSHKASAFVPFSVEIEGDWTGLATEMSRLFADAKDTLESTAFATGTGTDQPIGIVTALVAGSGSVANVAPTTDAAFGAVDVRGLFATLPPRFRPNASWLASLDVLNEIRAFDTTGGLSNQTVDLTAPYQFGILGRPVYENSAMDAFTGTTGVANLLVVGDFRNYVIFDRVGSRVELVPHLFGANQRPTGQRGVYFWWRVGADSVADQAFRLLRNT